MVLTVLCTQSIRCLNLSQVHVFRGAMWECITESNHVEFMSEATLTIAVHATSVGLTLPPLPPLYTPPAIPLLFDGTVT